VKKRIILSDLTPCGNAVAVKFHLQTSAGQNTFTSYGPGYVSVNTERHDKTLVITRDRIIDDWTPSSFDDLKAEHFEQLLALKPEIVLLGTGATLRFPKPALWRSLVAAGVGLEVMDNTAACRTFNILAAEGRNVAAAILLS